VDAYEVTNRSKVFLTSNALAPVLVEGDGDSRWVPFKQLATPTPEYTRQVRRLFGTGRNGWSELAIRELAGFAAALHAMKVDEEMARTPYESEARADLIATTRGSVDAFAEAVDDSNLDELWDDVVPDYERGLPQYASLDIPGRPDGVGKLALYATYVAFCRANGYRHPLGGGHFHEALARARPAWKLKQRKRGGRDSRPKGVNVAGYYGIPRDPGARERPVPLARVSQAGEDVPPQLEDAQRILARA
jgi:hypothetical protein